VGTVTVVTVVTGVTGVTVVVTTKDMKWKQRAHKGKKQVSHCSIVWIGLLLPNLCRCNAKGAMNLQHPWMNIPKSYLSRDCLLFYWYPLNDLKISMPKLKHWYLFLYEG
jgi:hypothetical protein